MATVTKTDAKSKSSVQRPGQVIPFALAAGLVAFLIVLLGAVLAYIVS